MLFKFRDRFEFLAAYIAGESFEIEWGVNGVCIHNRIFREYENMLQEDSYRNLPPTPSLKRRGSLKSLFEKEGSLKSLLEKGGGSLSSSANCNHCQEGQHEKDNGVDRLLHESISMSNRTILLWRRGWIVDLKVKRFFLCELVYGNSRTWIPAFAGVTKKTWGHIVWGKMLKNVWRLEIFRIFVRVSITNCVFWRNLRRKLNLH